MDLISAAYDSPDYERKHYIQLRHVRIFTFLGYGRLKKIKLQLITIFFYFFLHFFPQIVDLLMVVDPNEAPKQFFSPVTHVAESRRAQAPMFIFVCDIL